MIEDGFLPKGIHDLITLFAGLVAVVTLWQLLQLRKMISRTIATARQQNVPEYWPMAAMLTFLAGILILIIISLLHLIMDRYSPGGGPYGPITVGGLAGFFIGTFLGDLAKTVSEQHVHWSIHATVIVTAFVTTYFLSMSAWPESHILWITVPTQGLKAAIVSVPGILGYIWKSKSWECLANDRPT